MASRVDPDTGASLGALMPLIEDRVPAGVGKGHEQVTDSPAWHGFDALASDLNDKQTNTALTQFGTLGSGNHFVEVCLDTDLVEVEHTLRQVFNYKGTT